MNEAITWTNSTRKLSELIPWEINPARIGKDEARRLEESLAEFGQVQAIAISQDNEIYDGHQRKLVWSASKKFGPDYAVDVRVSSRPLTEDERKKLVIYLRKGAVGEFDFDMLANNWDFDDLLTWGFTEEELLGNGIEMEGEEPGEDPGTQVDKAEELRERWGVESGQLWRLGEHRLICGDCTDASVVARVMGGEKAELLFTSPPYLDARDYGGDDLELETISKFIPVFADLSTLLAVNLGIVRRDNEVVRYWDAYVAEAELAGLKLLSWNIWDRQQPWSMAQNTAMFPIEHEWIFVFGKGRKQLNLTVENKTPGTRTGITNRQKDGTLERAKPKEVRSHRPLGTLFRSPPHIGNDIGHPAMFPVVLPEAYIEACTSECDIVAEPFSGSGTTLIACERLGRKCRAIEISAAYCAVAIQRFFDITGQTPELISAN